MIGLWAEPGANPACLAGLASRIPADTIADPPAIGVYLALTAAGLELRVADMPWQGLRADWLDAGLDRRAREGRRALIARALGLRGKATPRILDATCGLGRDSAHLLRLGCRVTAIERSPVVATLVEDAANRASTAGATWIAGWRGVTVDDAPVRLNDLTASDFDAIYLDPMFGGDRRSALPKRELQMLRRVVGDDPDAGALLKAARATGLRVAMKHHPRSPALARPDHQVRGGRARFDVYLPVSGS